MNTLYDKAVDHYELRLLKALQKKASKVYPKLIDNAEFIKWVEEYMLTSCDELFEEYDIEVD